MESLFTKLRKNTTIDREFLKNSKYFDTQQYIHLDIPILNLAATGSFDGGIPPGITMIAAPPKHFKSSLMIQCMKAFQQKHTGTDNLIIFYDSEFGTPDEYFITAGVDCSQERFDRRPITNVEGLRSDIANLLNDIGFNDNVMICVDSLGMLPSKKEIDDAINDKQVADMTRAKQIKSMFRIINPQINLKQIPMIVVNHTYQTMDMFPEEVASGGRGAQYAGHTLWNIGKRTNKEGGEITGFDFVIRIKFSRYIREKSEFPITVSYEKGIAKYSGLFDIALELGYIVAPKQGWYKMKDWPEEQKSVRRSDIEESEEMMNKLLDNTEFVSEVEALYRL